MGGTVAVTLRKPDSSEYRMDRWTNSMPWGIMNMKMLRHDMAHVDEYLSQWILMRDDYEKNKDSGVFENEMTECYFPSGGLAPCGYGLVVVDMVNNVILSMQGYTSFDSMCAASIQLDFNDSRCMGGVDENDPESNVQIFKEFFEAGQVTGQMTINSPRPVDCENRGDAYLPVTETYDEIMAILRDTSRRDIFDFKLDLGTWSYEEFDECNLKELTRMHDRVIELGFVLSADEEASWTEAINEAKEWEGEDSDE